MILSYAATSNLFVESRSSHFMKALFENVLIIFGMWELEKDTGRSFGQTKASFEVHFLTNYRSLLDGELVRWSKQKCTLREKKIFGRFRVGVIVLLIMQPESVGLVARLQVAIAPLSPEFRHLIRLIDGGGVVLIVWANVWHDVVTINFEFFFRDFHWTRIE